MLTNPNVCRGAFLAASVMASTSTSYAQEQPSPKPTLIPGDADVIHDVRGIQIGMSCADAIMKSKSLSVRRNSGGKYSWLSFSEHSGMGRLDKADVQYSYTEYQVLLEDGSVNGATTNDLMTFACLEDGTNRDVFSLQRTIHYYDATIAPAIASLVGMFQEKYGVPSIKYSDTFIATMFSTSGLIESQDNDCGKYQNNHFYASADLGFINFDQNKCSYVLTFQATEARRPPGAIQNLVIDIIDYLRLTNTIRDMEKRRLQTTQIAAPKL